MTPRNVEAEEYVIGSVLIDPAALEDEDVSALTTESFTTESNKLVWAAIMSLFQSGEDVAIVSVTEKLRTTPSPRWSQAPNALDIVTLPGLLGYMDTVDSAAYVAGSARALRDAQRLRKALRLCKEGINAIQEPTATPDGILSLLSEGVTDLARRDSDELTADEAFARTTSVLSTNRETVIDSGYGELDRAGFNLPVGLSVVGGRPSMGKSRWLHGIHRHHARYGKSVMFSMDQPIQSIYRLEASMRAGVSIDRIRQEMAWRRAGGVPERYVTDRDIEEWRAQAQRVARFYPDRWRIIPGPKELNNLVLKIREAARWGADFVSVDYIQQIPVKGVPLHMGVAKLTAVTETLKNLAMELDLPIVAVSQLSREVDKRNNRRPTLADLRESGTIEQDATMVVFVYREEYYRSRLEGRSELPTSETEIILAKDKEGAIGIYKLLFDAKYAVFRELAEERRYGYEEARHVYS